MYQVLKAACVLVYLLTLFGLMHRKPLADAHAAAKSRG
jgi:hypothetical protein